MDDDASDADNEGQRPRRLSDVSRSGSSGSSGSDYDEDDHDQHGEDEHEGSTDSFFADLVDIIRSNWVVEPPRDAHDVAPWPVASNAHAPAADAAAEAVSNDADAVDEETDVLVRGLMPKYCVHVKLLHLVADHHRVDEGAELAQVAEDHPADEPAQKEDPVATEPSDITDAAVVAHLARAQRRYDERVAFLDRATPQLIQLNTDKQTAEKTCHMLARYPDLPSANDAKTELAGVCDHLRSELSDKTSAFGETYAKIARHEALCTRLLECMQFAECAVCRANVVDHVLIPCGHAFCGTCIRTMQRLSNGGFEAWRCPYCKTRVLSHKPIRLV